MWRAGATPHCGARAFHYRGLSCCGAQAPDAQAQQLWLTGPAAPRHVGSSQTRARARVPCIGRQTLNHCATREAPGFIFLFFIFKDSLLNIYLFVYLLAASGLSCRMWDLPLQRAGSSLRCAGFSLVVVCGLQSAQAQ